MTGFQAEYDALEDAANAVGRAAVRLLTDRDDVHEQVDAFLGHGWTGDAAESFVDAWHDWWRGTAAVLDGLSAMAELLAVTRSTYGEVDADARSRIDGQAVRLVRSLG